MEFCACVKNTPSIIETKVSEIYSGPLRSDYCLKTLTFLQGLEIREKCNFEMKKSHNLISNLMLWVLIKIISF